LHIYLHHDYSTDKYGRGNALKSGELGHNSGENSDLNNSFTVSLNGRVGMLDITDKIDLSDELKAYHNRLENLILERTEELRYINEQLQKEISKRERVEELLRREKERFHNYIDVVGIVILVLDIDGCVSLINQKGAELLGYDKGAIIGKDWFSNFIPEDEHDNIMNAFSNILKGHFVPNLENSILTRFGEKKLILWTNVPLLDEQGCVIGCISAGEDITDIRSSQEKLQKYADDLKRSDDLKLLFIDILRHDLLNPANIIKGYSEYLLETMDIEKEKDIVQRIHQQNEKLIKIINSASMFGKLESTEMICFEELDLLELLEKISREFLPLLERRNITLECYANGSYPTYANPVIEEAFSNLVSNAIKFSPHGGRIVLDIIDGGQSWKVPFTDFGIGILDEHKDAIFKRFKSFSGEGVKGSGLGLAIVKKIVELHDGEVGVCDNPSGSGSVFWIRLNKIQPS
jgi:PAS domain S-box-containing protein